MRGTAVLLVLLMVPLSGCISDGGTRLTLFAMPAIARGDPTPLPAVDCEDLLGRLNERALTQARVSLEQAVSGQGGAVWATGDRMAVAFAESTDSSKGSIAGARHTGTNNQEAAADEADLVKTDGEWTYVLSGGFLHILQSRAVGDIEAYARMEFPNTWGGQLLLVPRDPATSADDRLVVILQDWRGPDGLRGDARIAADIAWHSSMTRLVLLSLADRRAPQVMEEVWIEGSNMGARLVDGHVHLVTQSYERALPLQTWIHPTEEDLRERGLDWQKYYDLPDADRRSLHEVLAKRADAQNVEAIAKAKLADHLPTVVRTKGLPLPGGGYKPVPIHEPLDDAACRRVLSTPESTGRAVSTIYSLSASDASPQSRMLQVVAGSGIVYANGDSLVLASPSQDFWWFWAQPDLEEATDLHWFDLDGLDVRLRASGRVPGIVQDSFGIDVHNDRLRVATTTGTWGRWWLEEREPMLNHLVVLREVAGQLLPAGMVGGIAPGERIWSARFTDDRAYIVTFRNVDPLWVIDLTTDTPRILGELHIPGVSTYIHPLDDKRLLAIGYGPGPRGEDLDWSRIQVSLFDISNPRVPTRSALLELSPANGWSWSGATHEHKAFTYWDEIGTLAVPLSTSREIRMRDGYDYRHHVGLKLVDVVGFDLRLRGEVDQDALLRTDAWGTEIQRSYFLGYPERGQVSVYAVSDLGVTAHDWGTLKLQDQVSFA
jgi:uncharacterized secreted protein with C-terminal beta-propeller domain